jgi:hypothetical protein
LNFRRYLFGNLVISPSFLGWDVLPATVDGVRLPLKNIADLGCTAVTLCEYLEGDICRAFGNSNVLGQSDYTAAAGLLNKDGEAAGSNFIGFILEDSTAVVPGSREPIIGKAIL